MHKNADLRSRFGVGNEEISVKKDRDRENKSGDAHGPTVGEPGQFLLKERPSIGELNLGKEWAVSARGF